MNNENGALVIGTGVDTSGLESGLQECKDKLGEFGNNVGEQANKIADLLGNIPQVSIDFSETKGLDQIDEAFNQLQNATNQNREAIKQLSDEMERLDKIDAGTAEETEALNKQKIAINSNINLRRSAIAMAEDAAKTLKKLQQERINEISGIRSENKELEKEEKAQKKENQQKAESVKQTDALKQRIKEIQIEMANLVKNGIDQQSEHYQALAKEMGNLMDIQGDIRTQGNVFANDNANFQGILTGLSGVTGGFAAAQGAIGMFTEKNEELEQVMLKVQSVIAITTGLQQVANALNKDSAFTLVYVNKLKAWWNGLSKEGAVAQTAETTAVNANTLSNTANSVSQNVNTASKKLNQSVTNQETTSIAGNTASQTANTIAAKISAVAHRGLAASYRAVGTAMKSIPIAGWALAAITAVVAGITFLINKLGEAKRKQEELFKAASESAAKPIASVMNLKTQWDALGDNLEAKKKFIEENKQKFDELGVAINGVRDAENLLNNNTKAFIDAQIKKAQALALIDAQAEKVKELATNRQKEQAMSDTKKVYVREGPSSYKEYEVVNKDKIKLKKANDELEKEIFKGYEQAAKVEAEGGKVLKNAGINATKEYIAGSINALRSEISRREEDLNNAVNFEEYQAKLKDINKLKEQMEAISSPKGSIANINAQISRLEADLNNSLNAVDYNKKLNEIKKLKSELIKINTTQGSLARINAMISEKESELANSKSLEEYKQKLKEIKELKKEAGKLTGETQENDKKNEQTRKKAEENYSKAVQKFVEDAEGDIADKALEMQEEGMEKEIKNITKGVEAQKKAWKEKLKSLAEAKKQSLKEVYMTGDDATETGWEETDEGKKSVETYMDELMKDDSVAKAYTEFLAATEEKANKEVTAIRQKYTDEQIEQYGTAEEKIELIRRKWQKKMSVLPAEYLAEATKQMNDEVAAVLQEGFEKSVNWDGFFNNLSEQSLPALEMELAKVKKHLADNIGTMDDQSVKKYTEAISQMEEEIASRNPFTALHHSLKQMKTDKEAYVNAMNEMKAANDEWLAAEEERKAAEMEAASIQALIDSGQLEAGCEAQVNAQERVKKATEASAKAKDRANKADLNAINATNKMSGTYKKFASNLKGVGNVVNDVGGKAKNLAAIFKTDVGNAIGKAVDFTEELLDASSSVMEALGDVSKNVAGDVVDTTNASAQAMEGTSKAAANSIKTVEKASVILAVIGAALQVATAIANLLSNDEAKEAEKERLQNQIEDLQWELQNEGVVRLNKAYGDQLKVVKDVFNQEKNLYLQQNEQMLRQGAGTNAYGKKLTKMWDSVIESSSKKLATYYANMSYTANKALGTIKYKEARAQLENYGKQQALLQKKINDEKGEKEKDQDKSYIRDMEKELQENVAKAKEILDNLVEDIVGGSAEDIAKTLGDAFFEACETGEDAMKAWADATDKLIVDVLKKMMITNGLEEAIGKEFNNLKAKVFVDGEFKEDQMYEAVKEFGEGIGNIGTQFKAFVDKTMSDENLKEIFDKAAERTGVSKGIATASQESVDENNARLTTIQGHTFTLVQGVQELNGTANAILNHVAGIEKNTESLEDISKDIRNLRNAVDDMQTRGINIKA